MSRAYVAIGSNINKEENIRGAVRALSIAFGPLSLSPVYESEAQGFKGGNFYNLVAGLNTTKSIDNIKEAITEIEVRFGRGRKSGHMTSRTVDLDLLLYDDVVRHDLHVNLPHPDIQRYAFVLLPLADIAPTLKHPETGLTFSEMWRQFNGKKDALRAVDLKL